MRPSYSLRRIQQAPSGQILRGFRYTVIVNYVVFHFFLNQLKTVCDLFVSVCIALNRVFWIQYPEYSKQVNKFKC